MKKKVSINYDSHCTAAKSLSDGRFQQKIVPNRKNKLKADRKAWKAEARHLGRCC